ncbi:peptide ABC transporter substrate-binding protein [Rhodospirillaceae bacterium KN72]|uniref:Peptide ABC transporter substrate-binding protein n=1 Tax=Pacificispira spongiicola TaxID=2729598 RepID=A0A7Y0DXF9_9PROT|nr:ABC transporter substrate-binding protein [Pacificispira spongiicola]NMM43350.1 peptide ABC transporter substrate-binding protein [Pacificispira spongiicola]
MTWITDRRAFLKTAGVGFAAAMANPKFAWSAVGDTLRIRMGSDFQVLDPWGIIGALDEVIPRCTTVSLIRMGDIRDGNEWEPYGAEKIEWLDGKRLAFTLRDGLTWTGGYGPVTAEDVKYSFERIAGSDSAWAYQFEKFKEVEVIDDRNGIIHLTEAFAPFLVIALPYYGGHIVCKKAVEAVGGKYTTEIPAQCGPYLFDSWEQQQKVTLTVNPDWTGEKPAFSTVEIYIVGDDQAAQLAYEADAFDFTKLTPSAVRQLKGAMPDGATLIEAESTRYVWMTINQNAEPLKDIRVRQAIQYAFDADAVLLGAYDGLVGRSAGVVQPGTAFARDKNIIDQRDVEKAKALLSEAGAEGLTLNLVALTDSTSQTIAQIVQASLGEAGITVEIQPTEDAAYWALGDKTAGDDYLSLELVLQNFAGGIDPTENLVWFRPDQIGVYNWAFFDNAEYEELYQKSLVELDPDKRRQMFNRMEDLMEESGDFVFICFEPLIAIHDSDLKPVILADGHPDPVQFTKV